MKRIIILLALLFSVASPVWAQTGGAATQASGGKYEIRREPGSSGLAFVMLKGKCGYIDASGREVVPLKYDYVEKYYTSSYVEKWDGQLLVRVKSGNKFGFIDKTGREVIPVIYDEISERSFDTEFQLVRVKLDGKYGWIDFRGQAVIPVMYEDLEAPLFSNRLLYARLLGKYGYIDRQNRTVVPFRYSTAKAFSSDDYAPVSRDGKYGYIDRQGNEIIPLQYEFADSFHKGTLGPVVKNGKLGFIDDRNQTVAPFIYDAVYSAQGRKELEYGPFAGFAVVLKKNGKAGILDKTGRELTPFTYDSGNYTTNDASYTGYLPLTPYGGIKLYRNGQTYYFDERGTPYSSESDFKENHIRNLAEQGEPFFQWYMGMFYYAKWRGYPQDYDRAFEWFSKAAAQDEPLANWYLGYMYYKGYGVPKDYAKAFPYLYKAALLDYPQGTDAQLNIYQSGIRQAQYFLGWLYEHGQGVTKDLAQAREWYEKSASFNHQPARDQLAKLEGGGNVTPKPSPKPSPGPSPGGNTASMTWIAFQPSAAARDYSFKVGIKSDSKIEAWSVTVNGTPERGINPISNDGYDMVIDRKISLAEGANTIQVEVRNAAGTAVSEKTVTYNPARPAPQPKPQPAVREKRIALVIGNADYADPDKKLNNPVNDASDVAAKLERLGFTVIRSLNQNRQGMEQAINDFGTRAKGYDVALFYYAGHGIRCNGSNYLIPVDASLPEESYVQYNCTNANLVLDLMDRARCPMKIVILDACRNNPFARSWSRSAADNAGLDIMNAPKGTFIAFSTAPGDVAQDGKPGERNSPYTAALLQTLDVPNLSITDFFQEVLEKVATRTNERQTPWTSNSFRGKFIFNQK